MTTPIIVLVLLLLPAVLGHLLERSLACEDAMRLGGVLGLSICFALFAVGHFTMTDSLVQMLPAWIPSRDDLVSTTGLLEVAIVVGLLVPQSRRIAGWAAAAALILFSPANIYAAMNAVGPGGHQWGPAYLLVRLPLQLLLLAWTYWFVLRQPRLKCSGL